MALVGAFVRDGRSAPLLYQQSVTTYEAYNNYPADAVTGKITVFGGTQLRPNFHVRDCAELYVKTLEWPAEMIDGQIFNAGYQNLSINAIAELVRNVVGKDVEIGLECHAHCL